MRFARPLADRLRAAKTAFSVAPRLRGEARYLTHEPAQPWGHVTDCVPGRGWSSPAIDLRQLRLRIGVVLSALCAFAGMTNESQPFSPLV